MDTTAMRFPQVSTASRWTVPLAAGTARRIDAVRRARWLTVAGGTVWLTTQGDPANDGADLWLSAGEAVLLAAGAQAVVEAADDAAFQLVEPAAPVRTAPALQGLRRWWDQERRAMQLGAACTG